MTCTDIKQHKRLLYVELEMTNLLQTLICLANGTVLRATLVLTASFPLTGLSPSAPAWPLPLPLPDFGLPSFLGGALFCNTTHHRSYSLFLLLAFASEFKHMILLIMAYF